MHIQRYAVIFLNIFYCVVNNSQGTKPQKVHLQKTKLFQSGHCKLGHDSSVLGTGKRNILGNILLADYNSCCMHGGVSWKSLKTFCHINEMMNIRLLVVCLFHLRIYFHSLVNSDYFHTRNLSWDHFGNGIYLCIWHIKDTSHITDNSPGCQGTEGNNLNHTVFAVFAHNVIDYFLSSLKSEIHINIRHRYTFRIQKTLKQKVIFDGIQQSDSQCVRYNTPCSRASSRSYLDPVLPCIMDEIPYNQEIIYVSHILNGGKLVLQTFPKFWGNRIVKSIQAFETELVQVFPGSITIWHVKARQLGNAEFNFHMAALCDLMSILQCFQCIWKKSCHLFF